MIYFPKRMIGLVGVILAAFLDVGSSQPITPPADGLSRSGIPFTGALIEISTVPTGGATGGVKTLVTPFTGALIETS